MKFTCVLFAVIGSFSVSAMTILPRNAQSTSGKSDDYPNYSDLPSPAGYGNQFSSTHPKSQTCVSDSVLESLVDKYIATFSGIDDGAKNAKSTFDEKTQFYSQSRWWDSKTNANKLKQWSKIDNYPPFYKDRAALIKANTRPSNPRMYRKGPVTLGCNTFSVYWKADFSAPSGRTYGMDMAFVNPKTKKVNLAYSEYNTLVSGRSN